MNNKICFKHFWDWLSRIFGAMGHSLLLLNLTWLLTGHYTHQPGNHSDTPGAWAFMSLFFFCAFFYIIGLISQGILLAKWPATRSSFQLTWRLSMAIPLGLINLPFVLILIG